MGTRTVKKKKQFLCPLCTDGNEVLETVNPDEVVEHLFLFMIEKDGKKHIHVHGPISEKVVMKDFISAAAREAGFNVKE